MFGQQTHTRCDSIIQENVFLMVPRCLTNSGTSRAHHGFSEIHHFGAFGVFSCSVNYGQYGLSFPLPIGIRPIRSLPDFFSAPGQQTHTRCDSIIQENVFLMVPRCLTNSGTSRACPGFSEILNLKMLIFKWKLQVKFLLGVFI